MKATNEQLLDSYARTRSVKKTAAEFGMNGTSVHERLVKLGANRPINVLTPIEEDRLLSEYWIAAETGKLDELAADMGRTKQFICRRAKALGLTDQKRRKPYAAVWKYVGEESARIAFEMFKRSPLGLGKYCAKKGYDDLGFSTCMKRHFADEWEHVIEAKQIKQTAYKYGRQFEYRVRDHLKRLGYFAMRSPASKTPIDILAVRPGAVLFVQCKRSGSFPPAEWNELFELAKSCGAIPVLASCPTGRGTEYHELVARKDRPGLRQPLGLFDPEKPKVEAAP
jgi:Holliday junction resolvase